MSRSRCLSADGFRPNLSSLALQPSLFENQWSTANIQVPLTMWSTCIEWLRPSLAFFGFTLFLTSVLWIPYKRQSEILPENTCRQLSLPKHLYPCPFKTKRLYQKLSHCVYTWRLERNICSTSCKHPSGYCFVQDSDIWNSLTKSPLQPKVLSNMWHFIILFFRKSQ